MRDFRRIIAWQLADEFTVAIYQATRQFPREEIYGLTSQIDALPILFPPILPKEPHVIR